MAASHLTLEEAAGRLGIAPDEFKRRLKTDTAFKILVPIRDGSSLRFKPAAVDELARQLGAASDPELPLAPLGDEATPGSDDFKVPTPASRRPPTKKDEEPLSLSSTDDDIFSLAAEGKPEPKKKSDSDARLEPGKPKKAKDGSDEAVVPTEEIAIDFSGPGSAVIKGGSSSKLSAPKSSGKLSSGKLSSADAAKNLSNPGGGDSSEFELSLDADSDDFELKLNTEASDEVALGAVPKGGDGGSGKRSGESGINLREPSDSGISLEKGKGKDDASKSAAKKTDSDSDVDFELTLDSSAAASAVKLGGMKGKSIDPDSDSEFELTLDDSGGSSIEHAALGAAEAEADKGDIFETDFEIPPMEASDSGSEAVALESDTDLEKSDELVGDSDVISDEDTSGSEVVLLEDEDTPIAPAAKKGKPVKGRKTVADDDVDLADVEMDEEEGSASKALKGAKGRRRDEDLEDEDEAAAVPAGAYRPVPWGAFPGVMLLITFPLLLVGGLIGFELLNTMWGYQQPRKPAAPLVRELAKTFDMPLADQ